MELLNACEALDTYRLELAYEKTLRQNELLYNLEDIRKLRVQIFLLENDNGDLRSQISTDGDRLDEQACSVKATQNQLDLTKASWEKAQGELRIKNRETETLKVGALDVQV
ncbi:MAG: hypothetical protein Q9167_003413 [Letrouitia subvulpina]